MLNRFVDKAGCCLFFLCGFLTQSSLAQTPSANESPFIRVGKATAVPVIDGKLDDTAWRQAVAVSDFTLSATRQSPAEATQVKFVYDDKNLYVAWHCEESLLTVAQQRIHEVKTEAKIHDANVLSDDSVLMFFQPAKDGSVYEFNINSIGTLFDSRNKLHELWGSRDVSWNAGAVAKAVQEDGFWTAELAIPWQALGLGAPPANANTWEIGLGRNAVGRKEISSWTQNAAPELHLMSNFGSLVFSERVLPGLTSRGLPSFEGGQGVLAVEVDPVNGASGSMEIDAFVTEGGKAQYFRSSGAYAKTSTLNLPLATKSERPLFQWRAYGAGYELLYRSPLILRSAQSNNARLKISTDKPWKLFVNHRQIDEGQVAKEREIAIALTDGINDIVVEAQDGAARLQLTPPGAALPGQTVWRTHAAANTDEIKGFDRSSWKIAPQENNITGTPGAAAFLQHTLLWESTPHYPRTDPAFYIAQGTTQHLTFLAEGLKGIQLNNWQLYLALPPEIEIVGSSGFYRLTNSAKPKFTVADKQKISLEGREMVLYRIVADNPIVYREDLPTVLVRFEIFLRLAQGVKHDAQKEWPVYYWSQGNDGTVYEAAQSFPVRTAPPVNGKQPKKFVWEFWSSGAFRIMDEQPLISNILDTARQAGFNKYISSPPKELNDLIRSYGMKAVTLLYFNDSRTNAFSKTHLAVHPDEKLVDKAGKTHDDYICTTQVLGERWPLFAKSIAAWMGEADPDVVEYDYEYPPFNLPHACFCERCLKEFRSFSKLDSATELTPVIIQQKHATQWVDFMVYRTALLLKKIKTTVHETNPHVRFTAYSGYYGGVEQITRSRYGIDWDLVGQMQAVDEAGMGYGRPVPGIEQSIAALRGIPVKFGQLLHPYDERSKQPVAQLTQATLLRRALDATGGVLIYARHAMDGRSFYAIGETTRLIADYEELFLGHKLDAIPGIDSARVQLLRGEKNTLLCVLNETSKEARFNLRLPMELGEGREYYNGKIFAAGSAVELVLPPGGTQVMVFGATK